MKQIFDIGKFTFKVAVRKKAFIVSTIVIFILIFALCCLPRILSFFTGGNVESIGENFYTCYVVNDTEKFEDCEKALASAIKDTIFVKKDSSELEKLKKSVETEEKVSVLHIYEENGAPKMKLTAKDFLNGAMSSTETINSVMSTLYKIETLRENGVSEEIIALSETPVSLEIETLGNMSVSGYGVGMLLITLTFMAIYYYGYGVASSVAGEKSSRVMETLVVSAKPSKILFGKCLGMGLLGLCQFGGTLLFAFVCWKTLVPEGFELFGEKLDISAFTPTSALLVLLFFILGYSLYAMMNAVCGALIDKIEDLNNAMMPVMLISIGSFYLSYFTAIMGTTYDYLVNLAMYLPFSAPFIMPFVILNGEASAFQIILSLSILAATLVAVSFVSVRVYTASVLHYGKRLKLKDAVKLSKN